MGSHIFGFFGVRHFFTFTVSKRTRMFALWVKSRVLFIQLKKWVNLQKWKVTKLGSRKLHICPKMTKMGSIIGHKIDYNGVGALRGQRHIHSKNSPRYPPGANVQSLRNKWPDFLCYVCTMKADFFALTDTWFSQHDIVIGSKNHLLGFK